MSQTAGSALLNKNWFWLTLAIVPLLLYWLPGANELCELRRSELGKGQLWRLVTGHWTHYTTSHLFWDVSALFLLGRVAGRFFPRNLVLCLVASPLVISCCLLLWLPELRLYRGLSGIDAALFCYLAGCMWRREASLSFKTLLPLCLLLGFCGKVIYEVFFARGLFVSQTGFIILPHAHLLGGMTGLLCALLPTNSARQIES